MKGHTFLVGACIYLSLRVPIGDLIPNVYAKLFVINTGNSRNKGNPCNDIYGFNCVKLVAWNYWLKNWPRPITGNSLYAQICARLSGV